MNIGALKSHNTFATENESHERKGPIRYFAESISAKNRVDKGTMPFRIDIK